MLSKELYLENIESYCPSEVKLEEDDGPVSVPHLDDLVAVLPVDHPVLGQLQGVVHAERRVAPLVLHLVTCEPKTPDLQGTGLERAFGSCNHVKIFQEYGNSRLRLLDCMLVISPSV